jgi:CDP-diacylglycerol--serine O-phosphatidyltransferase
MITRPRIRRPDVPIRHVIPNLLTTVSLCSGLTSIHFSLKGDEWDKALFSIAIAAIFDTLDGRAARLLRASTRFGAVLDSLADFLSFGVAPAILLHQWMLADKGGAFGLAAVMTFVLCAALRLARFTSAPKLPPAKAALAKFFIGLPTPAAAGAVLIPAMLDISKWITLKRESLSEPANTTIDVVIPSLVIAHTFLIAILMISRVPMYAFKKVRIKRGYVPLLLVSVGLMVVFLFNDTWLAASTLAAAYLCTIPFSFAAHRHTLAEIDELEHPDEHHDEHTVAPGRS